LPTNFEPPTSDAIPKFKSTGKLRVDASQGCFQALNRADFQFRAAANFECRIFELSTSDFSPPELQIKRQTSCRRPLRLLPASNPELQLHGELRIEPPASIEIRLSKDETIPIIAGLPFNR